MMRSEYSLYMYTQVGLTYQTEQMRSTAAVVYGRIIESPIIQQNNSQFWSQFVGY